tara:strand:- start:1165 stop:2466 length:1302 start_codon:yes stop_codon:yes gene_type:complete
MAINVKNFLFSQSKNSKIGDFQDLDHIDGIAISAISAQLYKHQRDDVVIFYFRDGANFGSVYTKSKIFSENIKWNLKIKGDNIKALFVNTRNACAFLGKQGFQGIEMIAKDLSEQLTDKMKSDDEKPKKVRANEILFGCTGTIGEKYPVEKIRKSIPDLLRKIKYTQNKYLWMKAALGIMTTDTVPKMSMTECKIGTSNVKIYGIAKGSGMIYPNMATTLGYIFTDANISSSILKKLLKKNIETTFNAISVDSDTSTNDMVSIFATKKVSHIKIKNINDKNLKNFDNSVNLVLLELAKKVAFDGEGASKFVQIDVLNSRNMLDAKKIAFSIANSPLVKTAIAGEDPNWGRIVMAIGKAYVNFNINKLDIKFGKLKVVENGLISKNYNEDLLKEYMKNKDINIIVEINSGKKNFTAYTTDLTKKYIEINADYRS